MRLKRRGFADLDAIPWGDLGSASRDERRAEPPERIGHWTKMRRFHARFSESEASNRSPSSADSITTMPGFRFLAHTGDPSEVERYLRVFGNAGRVRTAVHV
jgi:hypothetical protein